MIHVHISLVVLNKADMHTACQFQQPGRGFSIQHQLVPLVLYSALNYSKTFC